MGCSPRHRHTRTSHGVASSPPAAGACYPRRRVRSSARSGECSPRSCQAWRSRRDLPEGKGASARRLASRGGEGRSANSQTEEGDAAAINRAVCPASSPPFPHPRSPPEPWGDLRLCGIARPVLEHRNDIIFSSGEDSGAQSPKEHAVIGQRLEGSVEGERERVVSGLLMKGNLVFEGRGLRHC